MVETSDSKRLKYINTECSPSYNFNNLTESKDKIYYIHNSEVQPRIIVIDKKLFSIEIKQDKLSEYITKLNGNETLQFACLKKVEINSIEMIAVGLYGGFKIWSLDGNQLIYQVINEKILNFKPFSVNAVTERRSKSTAKTWNKVVYGDSHGTLIQISFESSSLSTQKLYQHKKELPVTALTTYFTSGLIVVGFSNGQLIILDGESEKDCCVLQDFLNEYELPIVSLVTVLKENCFVSGYLNGEIRIYSYLTLTPVYYFQAHLKSINSLSVFENENGSKIISTGEDGYVNVYMLNNEILTVQNNIGLQSKIPIGSIVTKINGKISLVSCHYDNPVLAFLEGIN